MKMREPKWHGHVVRTKGTLMNTVLQGKVEGTRGRGRPSRGFTNDATKWMPLDGVAAMRRAEVGGGRRPSEGCTDCHGYGEEEEAED